MEQKTRKYLLIGVLCGAAILVIAYLTVPFIRYVLIPFTGGTKAPTHTLAKKSQKIMITVTQRKENVAKQFIVGTLANSTHVVNNVSQVPAEGGWINTAPLNIQAIEKQHKVILIDFWTYSCINCIRATPYTVELWKRYKDHGLVIIGVHSPEFAFEKKPANIAKATKRLGITYPVLTDANHDVWQAFGNHFWPAKYLISPQGKVVFTQFGEGDYVHEEKVVRAALKKAGWKLPPYQPTPTFLVPDGRPQTEELYAGPGFIRKPYGNVKQPKIGKTTSFRLPEDIQNGRIYVQGRWRGSKDYVQSRSAGKIVLNFLANTPYIVMGNANRPVYVKVYWDHREIPRRYRGKDIIERDDNTEMLINGPRLYFPISWKTHYGRHLISFVVPTGVRFYSFTFGSYNRRR